MKKSFILYLDSLDILDSLTDEQSGRLFKAIRDYSQDKEPELDQLLKIAFIPIKNYIDRDDEKWEEKKKKRSEAGKKGMESRWRKDKEDDNKQLQETKTITNDNNVIKEITNITVNDSVSVNVNNISKDIEVKTSETPTEIKTYGNEEVNKLTDGINRYLSLKLPEDRKSRLVVHTMLVLFDKFNNKGLIKKDREWLDDDKWVNAKSFVSEYKYTKLDNGYNPNSWYKVLDNVQLWVRNKGKLAI